MTARNCSPARYRPSRLKRTQHHAVMRQRAVSSTRYAAARMGCVCETTHRHVSTQWTGASAYVTVSRRVGGHRHNQLTAGRAPRRLARNDAQTRTGSRGATVPSMPLPMEAHRRERGCQIKYTANAIEINTSGADGCMDAPTGDGTGGGTATPGRPWANCQSLLLLLLMLLLGLQAAAALPWLPQQR